MAKYIVQGCDRETGLPRTLTIDASDEHQATSRANSVYDVVVSDVRLDQKVPCQQCGYDLSGIPGRACPECGAPPPPRVQSPFDEEWFDRLAGRVAEKIGGTRRNPVHVTLVPRAGEQMNWVVVIALGIVLSSCIWPFVLFGVLSFLRGP